jgi:hypothetical protein
MKTIMFAMLFLGAMSVNASSFSMAPATIVVETTNGELLEMPRYMETPVEDPIPGEQIKLGTFYETLDPGHLSRVLLCITKPETEEPFPFEIN